MKRAIGLILVLLATLGISAWHFYFNSAPSFPPQLRSTILLNKENVHVAIHRSAKYLNNALLPSGQFTYRINTNPKVHVKPKYNIVRHAGAIYSLGMYADFIESKTTEKTLKASSTFLKNCCLMPIQNEPGLLAVWSPPKILKNNGPRQVKLGGSGLGLVGLLSTEKVLPGTTERATLQSLGDFILYMQKPDGSFYSKYVPSKGGRDDSWTSLYYPGEAALGLVMLYELDPQEKWLLGAAKTLSYLSNLRNGKGTRIEPDHWALLATAKLIPHYDHLKSLPLSKKRIIDHAIQIIRRMLKDQKSKLDGTFFEGSFTAQGFTTPTSTRLEGLIAAWTFVPMKRIQLRNQMRESIEKGISFLIRSQIKEGKHLGGFPRAIGQLPKKHRLNKDNFNKHFTEIRIDYVQHAMSALIQYSQLFLE